MPKLTKLVILKRESLQKQRYSVDIDTKIGD